MVSCIRLKDGCRALLEDCIDFYENFYPIANEPYEKFLFTKKNVPFFRAEEEESNIIFCDDDDAGFNFMQIYGIGTATERSIRKEGITSLQKLVDDMDTLKFLNNGQRQSILEFWETVGFLFFEFSFSLS